MYIYIYRERERELASPHEPGAPDEVRLPHLAGQGEVLLRGGGIIILVYDHMCVLLYGYTYVLV